MSLWWVLLRLWWWLHVWVLEDVLQMADRWAQTGTGGKKPGKKDNKGKTGLQRAQMIRGVMRCKVKMWECDTAGTAEATVQPRGEATGVQHTFQGGSKGGRGSAPTVNIRWVCGRNHFSQQSHAGICNRTVFLQFSFFNQNFAEWMMTTTWTQLQHSKQSSSRF